MVRVAVHRGGLGPRMSIDDAAEVTVVYAGLRLCADKDAPVDRADRPPSYPPRRPRRPRRPRCRGRAVALVGPETRGAGARRASKRPSWASQGASSGADERLFQAWRMGTSRLPLPPESSRERGAVKPVRCSSRWVRRPGALEANPGAWGGLRPWPGLPSRSTPPSRLRHLLVEQTGAGSGATFVGAAAALNSCSGCPLLERQAAHAVGHLERLTSRSVRARSGLRPSPDASAADTKLHGKAVYSWTLSGRGQTARR